MIPNTASDSSTIGNLNGTAVAMSVDLTNLSHIMRVLTDLYTNPVKAVTREYSTNAIDSHAMAGQTRPIEIYTPTVLRQTLIIQDFGVGMSVEDIANTYGTYGASTKRETNNAAGCLGLGSKSALTYTTSFTVQAVKNGRGATVIIYRDDNGAGSMNIVNEYDTTEPNGVKVTIPVADVNDFVDAVEHFTYFLPRGKALVNGEAPKSYEDDLDDKAFWLDDKTLITPRQGGYIVMGHVAYPVNLPGAHGTIYFADMGEVEFVPSRDALNMTPATTAVCESVRKRVVQVTNFIQNRVTESTREGLPAVLEKYSWAKDRWTPLHWNGYNLDGRYNVKARTFLDTPREWIKIENINFKYQRDIVWFNAECEVVTAKRKRKIEKLIIDRGLQGRLWVEHAKIDHPLFDCGIEISMAEIDAVEVDPLPRMTKPKETPKYPWSLGREHHRNYSQEPLPDPSEYDAIVLANSWTSTAVTEKNPRVLFVKITENRMDKFLRLYPSAMSFSDWKKKRENDLPEISEIEAQALYIHQDWTFGWLANYKDKIRDKRIKAILDVDVRSEDLQKRVAKWYSVEKDPTSRFSLAGDYPLFNRHYREETIEYMNLVYKEN